MNDMARQIIARREARNADHARSGDYGRDYGRGGDYAGEDYGRVRNMQYTGNFSGESVYDGRRGVKGTGPYGMRDRASEDYAQDYRGGDYGHEYYGGKGDYRRDMRMDYGMDKGRSNYEDYLYTTEDYASQDMRLKHRDMEEWKRKIKNADGTKGEHFDKNQIKDVAQKIGIQFRDYNEDELCITANMLYSDYCHALKDYVPREKEALIYTKMARAFLDDEDGPAPAEKLALYYHCVVCGSEE
jgi:hypothetical protein